MVVATVRSKTMVLVLVRSHYVESCVYVLNQRERERERERER